MPPKGSKKEIKPSKDNSADSEKAIKKANRKKKDVEPTDLTGEGDVDEELEVDWGVHDYTWTLIAAILENELIKKGLFPPPGANASTKNGGGKVKTDFHFMLAHEVFGAEGCVYADAFLRAKTKKEKDVWARKIKNRMKRLTELTKRYTQELGETGAGINSAQEIDMSQNNSFTNKWEQISKSFPFFFEWRNLIGERPNTNPVGLGNSSTDVDLSVLSRGDGDPKTEDTDAVDFFDDLSELGDSVTASEVTRTSAKRKASKSDIDIKPSTTPGAAERTAKATAATKKAKPFDALLSVAAEEERTKQAQIALAQAQAEVDMQRVKSEAEVKKELLKVKAEDRRAKADYKLKKMEHC
ncbi:hypothetical protein DFH11DRAFT_1877111 [Phellopilus nigrolimitatus]|nr:hypothetical protein DFH11DRAFT_1877111 [Phellopilus nigrolimitatus]